MVTTRNRARAGVAALPEPVQLSDRNRRTTRQTRATHDDDDEEGESSETIGNTESSPDPESHTTSPTISGVDQVDSTLHEIEDTFDDGENTATSPAEYGEDSDNSDQDSDDDDMNNLLLKARDSLKMKAKFAEMEKSPSYNFPKLQTKLDMQNVYIKQESGKARMGTNNVVVVDKGAAKPASKEKSVLETCEVNMNADKVHINKKQQREEREKSAGKGWFDLPQQVLTPELKRDLQILKLRNVLDPKRFYKREDKSKAKFPKYFQVGTIIEGNTEFYSSRLTKKERATTITGEVMKDLTGREYYKRKFDEIQETKQSGGKRFMKKKKQGSKSWRAGK